MSIEQQPEPEQFYSPQEVAALFSLQASTINRWVRDGKIKAARLGGVLRIPKSEVLRIGNAKFGPGEETT